MASEYSRVVAFSGNSNAIQALELPAPSYGVLDRFIITQTSPVGTSGSGTFKVYDRRSACIGLTDLNVKASGTVSNISNSTEILTLVSTDSHNLSVGDSFFIKECADSLYNTTYVVNTVESSTSVTVSPSSSVNHFASLTTSFGGNNNDVTLTAKTAGVAGNDIQLHLMDLGVQNESLRFTYGEPATASFNPASGTDFKLIAINGGTSGNAISLTVVLPLTENKTLSASVSTNDITVTLKVKSDGKSETTAADLIALINSTNSTKTLVEARLMENSSGNLSGVSKTFLTGGSSNTNHIHVLLATNSSKAITTTASQLVTILSTNSLASISLATGNDGTGVLTALITSNLSGGGYPIASTGVWQTVPFNPRTSPPTSLVYSGTVAAGQTFQGFNLDRSYENKDNQDINLRSRHTGLWLEFTADALAPNIALGWEVAYTCRININD